MNSNCKLAFLLVCFQVSTGNLHYVRPNSSPPEYCPGQPCATLKDYISESDKKFTSKSVYTFMSGQHYLQVPLYLSSLANISWNTSESQNSATVLCYEKIALFNVSHFHIQGLAFSTFQKDLSVFLFTQCDFITFSKSDFVNRDYYGRAIVAANTSISVSNCLFKNNTGFHGGAILALEGTNLTLIGCEFVTNKAAGKGGALYMNESTFIGETGNTFSFNRAKTSGGAVYCRNCAILIKGTNNYFNSNQVDGLTGQHRGGAIEVFCNGQITTNGFVTFSNNIAAMGGALSLINSTLHFHSANATFASNVAMISGGGIYSFNSSIKSSTNNPVEFTSNKAFGSNISLDLNVCGAICLIGCVGKPQNILSPVLLNNSGPFGGALFAEEQRQFTFSSIYASDNVNGVIGVYNSKISIDGTSKYIHNKGQGVLVFNSGTGTLSTANTLENNSGENGAVLITNFSKVIFYDEVRIDNNVAISGGGAITLKNSELTFLQCHKTTICKNRSGTGSGGLEVYKSLLSFSGLTILCNNTGWMGGAIHIVLGKLTIATDTRFIANKAIMHGGALYASGTSVEVSEDITTFTANSARKGGAVYFQLGAVIFLHLSANILTSQNTADEYGGAFYYEDSVSELQCLNITEVKNADTQMFSAIPLAFLRVDEFIWPIPSFFCPSLKSINDTAGKDGDFLFGGLLDRSRMLHNLENPYDFFTTNCPITVTPNVREKAPITSDPYQIKLCVNYSIDSDVHERSVTVYRGQTFRLSIAALGQGNSTVSSKVIASLNSSATLKINQNTQYIGSHCSELTFNLFSTLTGTDSYEMLRLQVDGPCKGIGESSMLIAVNLLPCPEGFAQTNGKCICEDRLSVYNISCSIEDSVSMFRRAGSKFWMNATYNESGSYRGLVIYPTCPIQYCTIEGLNVSLGDPDAQCAPYRSGVLCGKCASNFSLMLGGLSCAKCSNTYLLLLLLFAFAGVFLTISLTVLRLTVSSGTLNGFILYSNIIQVNKQVFFSGSINPLSVFIAWMNLDFGYTSCFFDGLDAYTQTWLQYSFSLYVWVLISLVIIISRHSLFVSKIVGSNPTAVLATLLLMSYNKILKIIIDVFSAVYLEYPDGKLVTRWMKDANVVYLESKHLGLALFTISVLVIFFLPYTLLLLFGQWLYRSSNKRYCSWFLMRAKPLLDSYHAPYKVTTRYWTGFLLLIRCILYSIFSLNSLGNTQLSLLAIVTAFSAVIGICFLYKGIYNDKYLDAIEASVYLNLIAVSASVATLSENYRLAVAHLLIGIILATFLYVLLYHVYDNFMAGTALCRRVKLMMRIYKASGDGENVAVNSQNYINFPSPPSNFIREPLLEV